MTSDKFLLKGTNTTMTADELLILIHKTRFGTPPGFDYARYNIKCPDCGHRRVYSAMPYTKGFRCYKCERYYPDWIWAPCSGEGFLDGPNLDPVGIREVNIISNN